MIDAAEVGSHISSVHHVIVFVAGPRALLRHAATRPRTCTPAFLPMGCPTCRRCLAIERRAPMRAAAMIRLRVTLSGAYDTISKLCPKCGVVKDVSQFFRGREMGLRFQCRDCFNEQQPRNGRKSKKLDQCDVERMCIGCHQIKQPSDFHRSKTDLIMRCKACYKKRATELRASRQGPLFGPVPHGKICEHCHQWKEASQFGLRIGTLQLRTFCKACSAEKSRTYSESLDGGLRRLVTCWNHSHQVNARASPLTFAGVRRAYDGQQGFAYLFPTQQVSFQRGAHWKASLMRLNPELPWGDDNVAISSQEFTSSPSAPVWTHKKVEDLLTRMYACDPTTEEFEDQLRTHTDWLRKLWDSMKHRNKRRGLTFTITFSEFLAIVRTQQGRCAVSFVLMEMGVDAVDWQMSLERRNPSLGYTKENLCLVALEFNTMCNRLSGGDAEAGATSQWTRAKCISWMESLGVPRPVSIEEEKKEDADMV